MISTFHIVLAIKPISGNFVQNALKHGVAGINVDGCRISGPKGEGVWGTSNKTINTDRKFNTSPEMGEYRSEAHSAGRWPPNVILGHLEGCKSDGIKKVKGHKGYPNGAKGWGFHGGVGGREVDGSRNGMSISGHADADGKETVEAWECQEGCPVKTLDRQSGIRKTTWVSKSHKNNRKDGFLGGVGHPGDQGFNDTGGASRFFKQVKP